MVGDIVAELESDFRQDGEAIGGKVADVGAWQREQTARKRPAEGGRESGEGGAAIDIDDLMHATHRELGGHADKPAIPESAFAVQADLDAVELVARVKAVMHEK